MVPVDVSYEIVFVSKVYSPLSLEGAPSLGDIHAAGGSVSPTPPSPSPSPSPSSSTSARNLPYLSLGAYLHCVLRGLTKFFLGREPSLRDSMLRSGRDWMDVAAPFFDWD